MNYNYYSNGGGLSSIPKRTTLGGQDHMLSYITPQEAQMLREQGGGVTPSGGQYTGPGGLPSFWTPASAASAQASVSAAAAAAAQGQAQAQGLSTVDSKAFSGPGHGDAAQGNPTGAGPGTPGPNIPPHLLEAERQRQQGLGATTAPIGPGTTTITFEDIEEENVSEIPTTLSGIRNRYIGNVGVQDTPLSLAEKVTENVGEAITGQPNPFGIQNTVRGLDSLFSETNRVLPNSNMISPIPSFSPQYSGYQSPQPPPSPVGQQAAAPVAPSFLPSPIVQQAVGSPAPLPNTLSGIRNRYIGAAGGGGIQDLIQRQDRNYGVANQDSVLPGRDAFESKRFTPNQELMDGSYSNNIMQGHAVPLGMHSAQQPTKPFDPFPSGGQMNTDNTQYADFSRPQSFYSMPNMNRVT